MPPSPLDDRIVVALPRPVRPQELKLCLDTSYLDSVTATRTTVISTTVVKIRATNLIYMPSSNGSTRSSCGCSSASCCTVATYEKDGQTQSQVSASSPNLTSGVCAVGPTNQMVNNNDALSTPGGIGSQTSGPAKQLSAVRIIYPSELAKRITKCSKGHQPMPGPVIIDCRPFMEYNKSHIQGAVHINCSDKISRRRLQQGKITVLDLISCREGKDSFKRIFSKEIIVYDENTNDPTRVIPSQPLHVVLESLRREGKDPLVLKAQPAQSPRTGSCHRPPSPVMDTSSSSSTAVQQCGDAIEIDAVLQLHSSIYEDVKSLIHPIAASITAINTRLNDMDKRVAANTLQQSAFLQPQHSPLPRPPSLPIQHFCSPQLTSPPTTWQQLPSMFHCKLLLSEITPWLLISGIRSLKAKS
ncbi:UNVERIFIED_CONTAM: hypothetical protein FKN15_037784 [Acipenser sinensis]